jgi:hypothetical protein
MPFAIMSQLRRRVDCKLKLEEEEEVGIYTIVIGDRTVAVYNAPSKGEAESYLYDEGGLADDLTVLESEGKPILTGPKEAITLREATAIEYNRWQAGRDRESAPDKQEGQVHLLFLIPVRDPTSE